MREAQTTDEMYTLKQASLYSGVSEDELLMMVREGKLRAWALPLRKGLLVRKSDLGRFRRQAELPKQAEIRS